MAGAPRACGDDPAKAVAAFARPRVLPAHAGMIPQAKQAVKKAACAPRACGDDPFTRCMLSPSS